MAVADHQQLASGLYRCRVMHHRITPTDYTFYHDNFMFWLDLDALSKIDGYWPWIGVNRSALYRFDEADHLPTGHPGDLKTRVKAVLDEHNITDALGSVFLLTNLRVIGYVFNPVSFYFCMNTDGQPVGVIAEVGNTFGEMKIYFLPPTVEPNTGRVRFCDTPQKAFYVSPFGILDHHFRFELGWPSDTLNVSVQTLSADGPVMVATLSGNRLALSRRNLLKMTLRFPLITLQVISAIHWHAFVLWLRKTPFYRKDAAPAQQTGVLRPHHSLTAFTPTGDD